jgi:DNA-binding transcriptional ArsR family regulator
MALPADQLLRALRGAAEPTRLRLLAVLAHGPLSVTELTQAFGQSQPRLSRHLKLLCEAGLLERDRDQHWVYYRAAQQGPGAVALRALLALLDPEDPALMRDRARAAALLELRRAAGDATPGPDELAPDLTAVLPGELAGAGRERLLYLGARGAAVLPELSGVARQLAARLPGPLQARAARAALQSRAISNVTLEVRSEQSVAAAQGSADAVLVDGVHLPAAELEALLAEGASALRTDGRLLLVDDYERLAGSARESNPLLAVRARLAAHGLACLRLRPLDADGRHLLLAVAVHPNAAAGHDAAAAA